MNDSGINGWREVSLVVFADWLIPFAGGPAFDIAKSEKYKTELCQIKPAYLLYLEVGIEISLRAIMSFLVGALIRE